MNIKFYKVCAVKTTPLLQLHLLALVPVLCTVRVSCRLVILTRNEGKCHKMNV
jgi:hypothetical protein